MPNFDKLSEQDKAVLKSIFDPTLTIGEVQDDEDTLLDIEDAPPSSDSAATRRARELEARAVQLAESSSPDSRQMALKMLDEAVTLAPRAASYNNRAQLLRLMGRDDEAMRDLESALRLTSSPSVRSRSRARAQALCQRGAMLRARGRGEEARGDFAEAAGMGSAFAKKQMAELNPYAALCNQMLLQVMKQETDQRT